MRSFLTTLFHIGGALSLAQQNPKAQLIKEENSNNILLKLDYATYRGIYSSTNQVYVFKNIRYAAPPVGPLRWKEPAPPYSQEGEIQDFQTPIACTQPVQQNVRTAAQAVVGPGQEDCLFIDLTLPAGIFSTVEKGTKLPILAWIHGGYYTVGSKDERTFHQFAKASNGSMVSVAANYRLGMYGFFAGDSFEKDGAPNVGLLDQRAALEWVRNYLPMIGGDVGQVTTMGISAGAGSIMHHMTARGGSSDPLFQRAILQSAGYATVTDRSVPEKTFKDLESRAGCAGKGLECMRGLSEVKLKELSDYMGSKFQPGASGWDPIPDGKYITKTPTVEIAAGRFSKQIQSLISGHALNEGPWFIDRTINTTSAFEKYVREGYANRTDSSRLFELMNKLYPAPEVPGSPFKNTLERLGLYVGDAGFNCHHRALVAAYPDRTYTYQASLFGGNHYVDQSPSFYDAGSPINALFGANAGIQAFQSYLVSEVLKGDPNKLKNAATLEWPVTSGLQEKTLEGVLDVSGMSGPSGFKLLKSERLVKDRCEYWNELWK